LRAHTLLRSEKRSLPACSTAAVYASRVRPDFGVYTGQIYPGHVCTPVYTRTRTLYASVHPNPIPACQASAYLVPRSVYEASTATAWPLTYSRLPRYPNQPALSRQIVRRVCCSVLNQAGRPVLQHGDAPQAPQRSSLAFKRLQLVRSGTIYSRCCRDTLPCEICCELCCTQCFSTALTC